MVIAAWHRSVATRSVPEPTARAVSDGREDLAHEFSIAFSLGWNNVTNVNLLDQSSLEQSIVTPICCTISRPDSLSIVSAIMSSGVAQEAVIVGANRSVAVVCNHGTCADIFLKPIEATLLAVAIVLASGRLVPRAIQRLSPSISDIFLIISILNTIALFITDVMTYKLGGMSDDEPSEADYIKLLKVSWRHLSQGVWRHWVLIGQYRSNSLETTSTIQVSIYQNWRSSPYTIDFSRRPCLYCERRCMQSALSPVQP